jgi:hypothetical protein
MGSIYFAQGLDISVLHSLKIRSLLFFLSAYSPQRVILVTHTYYVNSYICFSFSLLECPFTFCLSGEYPSRHTWCQLFEIVPMNPWVAPYKPYPKSFFACKPKPKPSYGMYSDLLHSYLLMCFFHCQCKLFENKEKKPCLLKSLVLTSQYAISAH